MFELHQHPAKIINHNARVERHGEELKLASDLKLQVVVGAKALDAFDESLRTFLYRERTLGDAPAQARLDGDKDEEGLARRLPNLDPLSLKDKFPGYSVTIATGMDLVEPIKLIAAELSNFDIEAMDGGSVKLTFRATSYVSNAVSGELDGLQQREVTVSIEPPSREANASPQMQLLATGAEDPADTRKRVLVVGIATESRKGGTVTGVTCTLSDGDEIDGGEFAYMPTLDEIDAWISVKHGLAVEFSPSARATYEERAAA
ncbi:hypothetical protein [Arenimonas sp.]|uniref:hypothetical protein n=1 Tax=Arenimonas sp. TaxID=1872635 RepID=UPI0039E5B3DE